MKEQYFTFMQKIFDNDHAEIVPQEDLGPDKLCWYLPYFGVYHPKRKNKIRALLDAAAESNGVSLNKLLLSGPDLLAVLLRFLQDPVALVVDIEQMFHSLKVKEEFRDFLRFPCYKDNDPNGVITEYRMKAHIFGNTSSKEVGNYALRKTAQVGEAKFGKDAKSFVETIFT